MIKADKSDIDFLTESMARMKGILNALPVEVTINRVYVFDNNSNIVVNFSYGKNMFVLSQLLNEYSIRGRSLNGSKVLNSNRNFTDQIMEIIK